MGWRSNRVDHETNIWWQVFPNPSSGMVSVTVDQSFAYRLFSLDGKKIEEGLLQTGNNILDLSHLKAGTYIMEIFLPEKGRPLIRKIQVY